MDLPPGINLPRFEPGSVWLAGAGPGDPSLLTMQVVHALSQSDVVVYDALVGARILALARQETRLEYAGKRGGKQSPKQADISKRLVALARKGARVLRLKGGDPLLFGRGGEEALSLIEAGIPFRFLPGISSGLGGLAYAGIPLTHRDTNHVVTFVTGHDASGDVASGIDWQGLATGSPVIVFYMAMKHLATIANRLMAAGKPASEPVAVVCNATLQSQRVAVTTLGACSHDPKILAMPPPAIVVMGEVVRLRPALDWLGALEGRVLESDPLGRRDLAATG